MKKYLHYVIPFVISLIIFILSFIFYKDITNKLSELINNQILFIYSTTSFGLILTAYGIFFALAPLLRKDIKKSDDIKSVNHYFFVCLFLLLLQTILSISYFFFNNKFILLIDIFLFTFTICMFFYIIRGIRAIFNLILEDD